MKLNKSVISLILLVCINGIIIYFIIDGNDKALRKNYFTYDKTLKYVGFRKVCDLYHNRTILDLSFPGSGCTAQIDKISVIVENELPNVKKMISISECLSNIPIKDLQSVGSEEGDFFPCDGGIYVGVVLYGVLGGILNFIICVYSLDNIHP